MIQSVTKYAISQIFDPDVKLKYAVPKFQREYVWGKEQWEKLIEDLEENEEGYFLGSIITVNRGIDVLEIAPLEIIDGQQRLTTLSLIYAAIYSRLKEENNNDEEFINTKLNLKYRLINRGKTNEPRIELALQNKNLIDYRGILGELELINAEMPDNLGNRQIYRAYKYFKKRLLDYSYDEMIELLDKTNAALLVKIEVANHSDAFNLFDSLNNRGIPLSAIDIVKNNLLSALEKKGKKTIDEAFEEWKKIIDYISDFKTQERFLRQFYNSRIHEQRYGIKGINRATKSNLIRIYDNLIDKDPLSLFDQLSRNAKIYNNLLCLGNAQENGLRSALLDLTHVEGAPSYTFLLYLFSEHEKRRELQMMVVKLLVNYFVKRNMTDIPPTRDLDPIFINLIGLCRKKELAVEIDTIENYLEDKDRSSSRELFNEKLNGDIYEENYAMARFILTKVEEQKQTRENRKDLWELDKNGRYLWTIEHILPEGRNIPKEWVEMIADGDPKEAERIQKEFVHKLGNLTLSAYNPNLSNLSFKLKRDRTDKEGRCVGYKNGLFLNKDLAGRNSWTSKEIQMRTEQLVSEAIKLFSS